MHYVIFFYPVFYVLSEIISKYLQMQDRLVVVIFYDFQII